MFTPLILSDKPVPKFDADNLKASDFYDFCKAESENHPLQTLKCLECAHMPSGCQRASTGKAEDHEGWDEGLETKQHVEHST